MKTTDLCVMFVFQSTPFLTSSLGQLPNLLIESCSLTFLTGSPVHLAECATIVLQVYVETLQLKERSRTLRPLLPHSSHGVRKTLEVGLVELLALSLSLSVPLGACQGAWSTGLLFMHEGTHLEGRPAAARPC